MTEPDNISYVFQGATYGSPDDLSQAFRNKWLEAQDEVRSGRLRAWAASAAGHEQMHAALLKVERATELSDDQKLVIALAHLNPGIPLFWKHVFLAPAEIESTARLALGGAPNSEKAQAALLEALRDEIIVPALRPFLPPQVQEGFDTFIKLKSDFSHRLNIYSTIFHLYEKKIRRHNVYFNHDAAALDVLLFLLSTEHVQEMKDQAAAVSTTEALSCQWYRHLSETAQKEPVLLVFVLMLSGVAQDEANADKEWVRLSKEPEGARDHPLAPVMMPVIGEGADLRESLFLIGKYPITVDEYTKYIEQCGHSVREGWTYPGFLQDEKHPVVNISWEEAVAYAEWLSKLTSHPYSLPTEKQWIAAAGPSLEPRDNPEDYGTFRREAGRPVHGTTAVDAHPPNRLGIFDLSGNTWEWLLDKGRAEGTHLMRGGAWDQTIDQHRLHRHSESARENNTIGFRLVRLYGDYPPEESEPHLFYLPSVLRTLNVGSLEQGTPADFFNLAEMYRDGRNVPQDRDESIKWFKKAAEGGHLQAQVHLAQLYSEGRFVRQSEAEAAKWFGLAAQQGHRDAQMAYAMLLEEGRTLPHNAAEAARWFTAAAEQGNFEAQYRIARMLREGRGVAQNDALAAAWFQRAAEGGHPIAQYELGCCIRDGRGLPKNEADALTWFSTAALQGHLRAQIALAELYRDGKGTPQSETEAFHWFMQAANRGELEAQYQAANMLASGRGTIRNEADALKWFGISGQQGHLSAQIQAAFMYKEGRGCSRDWAEAMRWFQMAAGQGDPEACFELAEIYWLAPEGMPKRENEALSLYRTAAQGKYPGAAERVAEIESSRKRRHKIRIAIFMGIGLLTLFAIVFGYLSMVADNFTLLVQQSSEGEGEDRVLLIKRLPDLDFWESADSICLRETRGTGPKCRQWVADQIIPRTHIIREFGYSEFAYNQSMGTDDTASPGQRLDRAEFTSSAPPLVSMGEPYVYNVTTSGNGFRNIIVMQKPSWLTTTRADVRAGTLTFEGTPTPENNAAPGPYSVRLRLDDGSNSLIYPEQSFTITIRKTEP